MSENDKRIIELLKKDDERALNELFHLYYNKLYFFSIEFVGNSEDAREIVQDAMMRFWQRRKDLKNDSSIMNYLLTVVRNLSLNYLRQFKNKKKITITNTDVVRELSVNYQALASPVWDQLLTKELNNLIENTIGSLTDKCRKVFELSRYEEKSNVEISQILNISVKTVEGHITEALKTIRSNLLKYMYLFF